MTSEITTYLKYANVQMAAEALLVGIGKPPSTTTSDPISVATLTNGNNHASRFTKEAAEQFVKDWAVVEHISNTATGFSGTLFKARQDDAARGIRQGELVLSFRSTEFIDDAARDNQATNSMEIKPFGWAFGQIADMEDWYTSLQSKYAVDFAAAGFRTAVTGYSLGGHLATVTPAQHYAH